jgi:phosphatidylglycerol:prolipoprotein diacylglycerol transferase
MLPVLLDLKFVKIYTFGVFLVLALIWSMFLLWRNVKVTSFKEEDIFDLFFTSILGSLFFARLLYVIAHFSRFKLNLLKFILINGYPGLSLYGGLIGGFITFFLFLHAKKIAFKDLIDYFIPSLFIALAIGKIGSFISGVDVGTKTKLPLSVWYAGYSGNRHITALYESILFFLGTYIAYRIILSIRRTKLPAGFGFTFFIFYFSLVNLFLDKFKENHLYFAGFNINLSLSLVTFIGSSLYVIFVYLSTEKINRQYSGGFEIFALN